MQQGVQHLRHLTNGDMGILDVVSLTVICASRYTNLSIILPAVNFTIETETASILTDTTFKEDTTLAEDAIVWKIDDSIRTVHGRSQLHGHDGLLIAGGERFELPESFWQETCDIIKQDPDWMSNLSNLHPRQTDPDSRLVVPHFPRWITPGGVAYEPDGNIILQEDPGLAEQRLYTLNSRFSSDSTSFLGELSQHNSKLATTMLLTSIMKGDDTFDEPWAALPFRSLTQLHTFQYIADGRPCLTYPKPIADGVYAICGRGCGFGKMNPGFLHTAIHENVPLAMKMLDKSLRDEYNVRSVECEDFIVTIEYDASMDIPETFVRAARDVVHLRNDSLEFFTKCADQGVHLLVDGASLETHTGPTDRMNKRVFSSTGPRPVNKGEECPCKHLMDPCPCWCLDCTCLSKQGTNVDPLYMLGQRMERTRLVGAAHVHYLLHVCYTQPSKAVLSVSQLQSALSRGYQHLNVKTTFRGGPACRKLPEKRSKASPFLTASGHEISPFATTLTYCLKDQANGNMVKLQRAFANRESLYTVSLGFHHAAFKTIVLRMIMAGLRANVIMAYDGAKEFTSDLEVVAFVRNPTKQRLQALLDLEPDNNTPEAPSRHDVLSRSEVLVMEKKLELLDRSLSTDDNPAANGSLHHSPRKVLDKLRIAPDVDAGMFKLSYSDCNQVKGMLRQKLRSSPPPSDAYDPRVAQHVILQTTCYAPESVTKPNEEVIWVNGMSTVITRQPETLTHVENPLQGFVEVAVHPYEKKNEAILLLCHLALYTMECPPAYTGLIQVYILGVSGSGKTTLAEALRCTFHKKPFTPAVEASPQFAAMSFSNKCKDAIWLEDEFMRSTYESMTTSDFNKLAEGKYAQMSACKHGAPTYVTYQGWCLFLGNYAPYQLYGGSSSPKVLADEFNRRFRIYGFGKLHTQMPGITFGSLRPVLDAIVRRLKHNETLHTHLLDTIMNNRVHSDDL